MALLGWKLAVSIPDTVLEEKASMREKTAKLGLIARACSIYGVDAIEIFRDAGGRGEWDNIRKVLEFLETPQYLRRRLFPLDDTLRYAGILPPLRIPSHRRKRAAEELRPGELREGLVDSEGTVDIGLESPAKLNQRAPAGRTTVAVVSVRPLLVRPVQREEIVEYWGYKVRQVSAAQVMSDAAFKLRIATSRLGSPLGRALGPMADSLGRAGSVKMIFGAPARGLFDIFGENLRQQVDHVVNIFPGQQVETVRTEEAILAGLGLLSFLSVKKA